ncbi:hypothetical protein DFH06DRAFT_1146031 [Mycena polygramma]|nr:hypothetical protein DFH06DRAFT_1146031 [Mycena polygramma]
MADLEGSPRDELIVVEGFGAPAFQVDLRDVTDNIFETPTFPVVRIHGPVDAEAADLGRPGSVSESVGGAYAAATDCAFIVRKKRRKSGHSAKSSGGGGRIDRAQAGLVTAENGFLGDPEAGWIKSDEFPTDAQRIPVAPSRWRELALPPNPVGSRIRNFRFPCGYGVEDALQTVHKAGGAWGGPIWGRPQRARRTRRTGPAAGSVVKTSQCPRRAAKKEGDWAGE